MSPEPKSIRLPQSIISAVENYLVAKAHSILQQQRITPVYNELLKTFAFYAELDNKPTERILDRENLFLSQDTQTLDQYLTEVDRQLKERGLKPIQMARDHCPAYSSHHQFIETENLLIRLCAPLFGFDADEIQTAELQDRNQFVELVVNIAILSPNFKSAEAILKRHA